MSSTVVSRQKTATKQAAAKTKRFPRGSQSSRLAPDSLEAYSLPVKARAGQPQPQADFRAVPARPGDHHSIHRLLVSVLHQPSPAEFQAEQEEPSYESADRLLVKRGEQIIAHAHLVKRELQFGSNKLPIAIVSNLALAPEVFEQPCGTRLLRGAEEKMLEEEAVLGVLRTRTPEFFAAHGWCVCLRHSYSIAGARRILSHLREHEPRFQDPLRPSSPPLNIRIWRHVEQAALMRLYDANRASVYGPLLRADNYWRWLISRRAYDRIYVAINGPDKIELDDACEPIVGYAVMKEGRILEMVTAADWPQAGTQLLARACRDAIEHDLHDVRLDAAPDSPLHDVLASAGGERYYHEVRNGEVFMVKLFEPLRFLTLLEASLQQRVRDSDFCLPVDLGINLDGQKFTLAARPRSVKLVPGKLGRSYLDCSRAQLSQLMLGHLDVPAAIRAGRLHASTRLAGEIAAVMFPQLPIWRPPWDELPA